MCYSNINVTIKLADIDKGIFVDTISLKDKWLKGFIIITDWSFLGSLDENKKANNVLNKRGKLHAILRIKKVNSNYSKILKEFEIDIKDENVFDPNESEVLRDKEEPLCLNLRRNFEIKSIPLPEAYGGPYYIDIILNKIINDGDEKQNPIQMQSRTLLNVNTIEE